MSAENETAEAAPSIVYVDDDDDLLKLTKLCFNMFGGIDIVTCRDVDDFMQRFEKGRFDLLLFDWQMPGMTGIELAEWVRCVKGDTDATIILVTARDIENKAEVMQRMEIAGVIAKPFEPDRLPLMALDLHRR